MWKKILAGVFFLVLGLRVSEVVLAQEPVREGVRQAVQEAVRETGVKPLTLPVRRAVPVKSKGEAALEAAKAWLALVDQSYYGTCWDEASAYTKGMFSKAQLSAQLSGVRSSLGALQSRAIVSKKYQTTLPGAPVGEYFLFSFKAVFSGKPRAFEALTMALDPDGRWRMAGYYIQ